MLDNDTLDELVVAPTRYANFGPRLLAAFLDFLFTLPLGIAVFYFTGISPDFTMYLVVIALVMLYKPGMEKVFGATLGKMVTKLHVVTESGENISWVQAIMRYLPWLIGTLAGVYFAYQLFQVPGYTDIDGFTDYGLFMAEYQQNNDTTMNSVVQSSAILIPLISALIMLGNKKRQAAHDTLAETFVIHKNPVV